MALFRPIVAPADLPALGTGRESGTFDFKGEVDTADQRELAKDAAAFANALGGVVLVGAFEAKGTLGHYAPMTRDRAEEVKVAYERAIVQRCHPQPVVDVVRIETATPLPAGYVVAVNIYAMPLGPVGVRWDSDKTGPSFAFPLRTTAQTHYMTPMELAMLMVPEIRRVATLLEQIPLPERRNLRLTFRAPPSEAFQATLLDVDLLRSTVNFEVMPNGGRPEKFPLALPIDHVASVWRKENGMWMIVIDRGHLVSGEFFPR